jgi:hypothetical protein
MENSENTKMDIVFEKLLQRASQPIVPDGAEHRVMAAIRAGDEPSNVVQFRPRRSANRWAIGLPLAASLLLGIYLGTRDTLDSYLPDSVIGATVAGATDSDVSSGLDDIENYSDGELT